ncbi:hypothetical protein CM19_00595 [Candidatus Acidianus copahuensis]|uniref:Xaa-Pro dipeptidyl-peptidase-like domain-containing protein n=1 Tax=Candidatus Acidianus copahuensis TaxID=1160895 RepID=A0A031LV97_9CREN|nr:alpha/beta hydrolase [Candidatus Acidianus copahuensis]EZQ11736.1 hypothetical protein CM19_00595 [Candidatus Acidianus copahuensis]
MIKGEYTYKRINVEFMAEGVKLKGWLYLPEREGKLPAVVMSHGFSAVKEMYLDSFAEVFSSSGLAVLVYDNRNFGDSEGEPRQEINPWAQVNDYRYAISYVRQRLEIDPNRIGKRIVPGPETAAIKLVATEASQRLYYYTTNELGINSLVTDDESNNILLGLLSSFAGTIGGGTSEILRNLLGEHVLKLPK